MIAAGLCMMGGCFAQDASTQTVETYWPAHSVRVEQKTIVLKAASRDLLLPFWAEGMKAGGRLENANSSKGGNVLAWGTWDNSNRDAVYFGTTATQPVCSLVYDAEDGSLQRKELLSSEPGPLYKWMEVVLSYESGVVFTTPSQTQTLLFPGGRSPYLTAWRIRIMAENFTYVDVVSFWWMNDIVQKQYFMAQPMCSVAGESAFFTHGFNILTEL